MTILSPRREVGEFKKRYKWMALFVLGAFSLLAGRMIHLQLFRNEHYAAIARENITKTIELPATRGVIRDTAGRVIADNRPSYNVYITPQLFNLETDLPRMAELMALDPAARASLTARIERVPPSRRTHQIEMFADITREQLAALETHAAELPGVDVVAVPVRTYPFHELAGHAIGYMNEITAEELARLRNQDYDAGDGIGRAGVERAWESYLRGRAGYTRVIVDARGDLRDMPESAQQRREIGHRDPIPGRDLTLSLDMELMRTVDRAFRGQPSGGAVVVDVRTGRVRALFSKPSYDLNEISGRLTEARQQELLDNPFRPLIDKTLYESYFPGSTFKPISALAALSEGLMDPASRIDCDGFYELGNRRFRCTQSHGELDMRRALIESCNVYFYRLAEQVGLDRLARYAREFGLGTPTGIGIEHETSGFVATREWYRAQHDTRFRIGFTLNTAIGQGNTRATLLQIAMLYAAIANGGTLYVPQLVEQVRAPDGTILESFPPRVRRRVNVPQQHLAYVIEGLYGVVNDPKGTAYDARIEDGVPVAGKTGTAQVSRRAPRQGENASRAWYYNRDHAWFAGFAPAGQPEVAVVVLLEHGGAGGKNAAPLGVQILQEYLGGREAAAPQHATLVRTSQGGAPSQVGAP